MYPGLKTLENNNNNFWDFLNVCIRISAGCLLLCFKSCVLPCCRGAFEAGCRSCRLFYVNEQIHFHAWLVSGQPVTNGPGFSSLSGAKTHH